eukprot:TRINITY_DN359_c1_g1_i1.p1 TRINITY_DN359_c1_g1~~TRINITY_DN359_c1_g1_i1.p1  ORF type:complete len:497 (+),score=69.73 TRINITY_DN359_c1_g1_i1:87-1577(+)
MASYLGSALGDAVGSVGSFMNAPRLDAIPESDSRISSAQFGSSVVGDGDDIHACRRSIQELKDDIGLIRTEQSQAMDTLGQLTVTIAESLKSAMQRFEKRLMLEMDARCEALERKFSEQTKKWSSSAAASDRAPSVEMSRARSPSSLKSPHGSGPGIRDSLNSFGGADSLSQSNRSVSTTVSEKKQPSQMSFASKFGKISASIEQSFQSLRDGAGALPDDASDHGSTGGAPSRISFGGEPASSTVQRVLYDLDSVSNASSGATGPTASAQAQFAKGVGARAQSEDLRAHRQSQPNQQHSKPEVVTSSGLSRSRAYTRDRDGRPHETSQPPPQVGVRADSSAPPPEGMASGKSAEGVPSLRRQQDRSPIVSCTRSGNRSPTALSPDSIQFRPDSGASAAPPSSHFRNRSPTALSPDSIQFRPDSGASAAPPSSHFSNMMGANHRGGSMALPRPGAGLQQGAAAPQGIAFAQPPRASSQQGAMMGGACAATYPHAARR